MKTELVNLTPHEIRIESVWHRPYGHPEGEDWVQQMAEIKPSGKVARVESRRKSSASIIFPPTDDGWHEMIATSKEYLGEIIDLPDPTDGEIYIVSAVVLAAVKAKHPERTDVYAPDTLNATRNEKGHIVSVPRLIQ